jgi:hypothetical protein
MHPLIKVYMAVIAVALVAVGIGVLRDGLSPLSLFGLLSLPGMIWSMFSPHPRGISACRGLAVFGVVLGGLLWKIDDERDAWLGLGFRETGAVFVSYWVSVLVLLWSKPMRDHFANGR